MLQALFRRGEQEDALAKAFKAGFAKLNFGLVLLVERVDNPLVFAWNEGDAAKPLGRRLCFQKGKT